MTKKTRNSLIVTIFTLIIFAQYGSGILIEQYYKKLLVHTAAKNQIKPHLVTFKRGFFNSTANVTINIPTGNSVDSIIIPLQQKIIHGPIILDFKAKKFHFNLALAHIYSNLEEKITAKLLELFHNARPFTIMTKLSFLGNGTTYFEMIPIQQTKDNTFTVNWQGLTGKIKHSLNFTTMKGELIAPELSVIDTNTNFSIINAKANVDTKENNNLTIGDSSIQIANLVYKKHNKTLFSLNNFTINSLFNKEKNLVDKLQYVVTATIDSAKILKQEFAKNTYNVTVNSISPQFFTVLHENYNKKITLLNELLQQLLASEAKITLTLPKYFTQAFINFGQLQLHNNSILAKLDQRTKKQILIDIANKTTEQFDSLVTNKIFTENNEQQQYQLHLNFNKSGKILLNGEQLQNPFQALQNNVAPNVTVPQENNVPENTANDLNAEKPAN